MNIQCDEPESTPAQPPREIILRLRPLKSDVPWPVRIRRALKALGRVYGFRCESFEVVDTK